MLSEDTIMSYQMAKEQYAKWGVDVELALKNLDHIALSIHCWQGDDVGGFEVPEAQLSGGGIQVTGSYPGKARTIEELRKDLLKVYSMLPGKHRLSLHAIYGEFGDKLVDRDEIEPEHFSGWVEWANQNKLKIDFNCTCFSHPKAESGYTLSSKDLAIRNFWINHVRKARKISSFIGQKQSDTCIHNIWIPDGSKDFPIERYEYRKILKESLDEIFSEYYPPELIKDSLESKLFGIGSEAFVVGSHEFYMGYALKHNKMLCIDMGHFHPTELIADKISAILQFSDQLLLHISRGLRWDSDHVVIVNDDLLFLCQELVRSTKWRQVILGLDFFDASLNRVGAWVVGARAVMKALLVAFLEPTAQLCIYEEDGDFFARLALLEACKVMPFGVVWDYYCQSRGITMEKEVIEQIHNYEKNELSKRY
jgi:L-rhamnose isomerase